MTNELSLRTDAERAVELEACETRIFSAFRRGLEATCDIGRELVTIETNKLYEVRGWDNLKTYAERDLRMDEKAVRRSISTVSMIERLEGAGIELPSNESQLVELARLPDEHVAPVWEKLVTACEKKDVPVTVDRVRAAVNLDLETQPPAKPAGVKVKLTADEPEPFSENGLRALARIRRICGEQIAAAIESGTRALTERAVIRWADLKDQQMKDLVYYVIDQSWSVTDAINYEEKSPNPRSTLSDMALRARARGGRLAVRYEEFLITIDRAA